MANIRDVYTTEGKRFFERLYALAKLKVKIGFRSGEASESDGTDICQVAVWNELGTSNIPSRPFLRESIDLHEDEIREFAVKQKGSILNGTNEKSILKKIGVFQKGIVQKHITEGSFVPNSPSTVRSKGSSKPLIDTGTMRQSVDFVIAKKGED